MQGQTKNEDQPSLFIAIQAPELEDGIYKFLAENRTQLFPDHIFAELFPSKKGRKSLPASTIASILLLQSIEGLSDRQAEKRTRYDLAFKLACGIYDLKNGVDHTTLFYWRKRIADCSNPNIIFDTVLKAVQESGVIDGKTKRALDSTIVDDAVAQMSTFELVRSQIARIMRLFPGTVPVVEKCCTRYLDFQPEGYRCAKRPDIDWQDENARNQVLTALVEDAFWLCFELDGFDAGTCQEQFDDELGRLGVLAGQDVELIEVDGNNDPAAPKWRIKRGVNYDRIVSTVDPETRCAHKTRSQKRNGFKGNVTVEPETGIITNCELTAAVGEGTSDAEVGYQMLMQDPTVESMVDLEVLADSAYATGDMLVELKKNGADCFIKPKTVVNVKHAGGFTNADFRVEASGDGSGLVLVCPNGNEMPYRPGKTVSFGAWCDDCPLKSLCTLSDKGRTVTVGVNDPVVREHRIWAASDEFDRVYTRWRPMVEGSIAAMTRNNGRRCRFVGVVKNRIWWALRAAAINVEKLAKFAVVWDGGWKVAAV